ncbi:glycosyltransferase [Aminivibrio sp.]|jgi:undecaprenyl-phosphate 4-deoxy-4-formamido-L-arabinose transferase|uniref:glycosyltransferase n=1 Tax=Aminivibrio sp. TaxID=1872489 RepID=UPI001D429E3E|nr:glycosyltransferase [Synergistales bacterium]
MPENKKLVSVIVPVYNEQESLPFLMPRLLSAMEGMNRPFEIIFVNDGSRDNSLRMLYSFHEANPKAVRIIDFNGNFGQHMAIMAGFDHSRGEIVITLDADLQNPPEEIPRIVEKIDAGHDVVGTIRQNRQDPKFRKMASRIVNSITNRITGLQLNDYGCMLRGYRRDIVNIINQSFESTTFIPALAQKFAVNPVEIPVMHSEREHGTSKYSFFRLIRLNFDLMTGFSLYPLQAVTMIGMAVSILSFLFVLFLLLRRLVVGPEAEGVFTLLNINFFLMGITMSCVGIIGEYIGRIYSEVRKRPRYVIRREWDIND